MKKRVACVLALGVVFGVSAVWLFFSVAKASTAYNTIRVKLSTKDGATSLSITVGDNYRISQDTATILDPGVYTVSLASGKIKIAKGTFSETFGSAMTLERCQSKNVNTITLHNEKYGCDISYLGNMTFTTDGTEIQVINTVPLEQYLLGVVGYELSDSFPMEALKAQAVAARGYAIKSMNASSAYDIGDTSSDQVYRGYHPDQTNVIAAVNATAGQVMTYNGAVCKTFFAASNGGKTEYYGNWSGGGEADNAQYPYLVQKDDPYDLKNPASLSVRLYVPKVIRNTSMDPVPDLPATGVTYQVQIVNLNVFCTVYASASTSANALGIANKDVKYTWIADSGDFYKIDYNGTPGYIQKGFGIKIPDSAVVPTGAKPSLPIYYTPNALLGDLQQQAYTALRARGEAVPDKTNIRLLQVTGFRNGTPRFALGNSNCYVTADADLVVQYVDSDRNLVDNVAVTVSITLMNKDSKGNFINDHDYLNNYCRMRFVEATSDGFDIVCRRNGHGVGLSQRGAQQMALDGKDYAFILTFYYDGAKVSPVDTTIPALPSPGSHPHGQYRAHHGDRRLHPCSGFDILNHIWIGQYRR